MPDRGGTMSATTKPSKTRVTLSKRGLDGDALAVVDVAGVVTAAQSGDPAAFAELVTRFEHTVYRTALRVTHDPEDAADVGQQTWLTVMQKLAGLRSPECFPGWLVTTARRSALRFVRDRDRLRATAPDVFDRCPDPGETVEVAVERGETVERLRRGIARLPRERAYVLVELVCNERSYKELAAELGRPVGSLGPSRARYLRKLAEEMAVLE